MLKAAPDPVDVQDLQFKLRCRLKVFDNTQNSNFSKHCNLVACASRFGLIFIGTNTSIVQAIPLKNIEEYTKSDGDKVDYPKRNLSLLSSPIHLSVNCEHTVLAIVYERNNCPWAVFYDVRSAWQHDFVQLGEVCLSPTPTVDVIEVNWNPALACIFTACKSDGTLGIYELKNPGIDINELPAAASATCFCWSPKGKQIAVGSRDGKITQYKPDLKAVKVINAPPLKEPHSIQSLQWVSNYQFIGVFQPINPDNQASFIVIDTPKSGDLTYINYDDICYSNGNTRPVQFYMILLQNWNILMAASSNSMEVGILGNTGNSWTQWIMGDAARAELPLSSNHQETLPVGCALDIGSTQSLQWGESTFPPVPLLLLFSHHGILCCFNVVNLKEGIPSICTPPDPIKDMSGLQYFVTSYIESKSDKHIHAKEVNKPQTQETTGLFNVSQAITTSSNASTFLRVQPNAAVTHQGLNISQGQPLTLFGGQAILAPVNKANSSIQPPQTLQQPLYPSLPNKDNSVVNNLVLTEAFVNGKTSPAVLKSVVSTASSLELNIQKLNQPELAEEFYKSDIVSVDLKVEEEAECIFAQMVREECIFLESELKAVLHQGKSLKLNLGTENDKTKIVECTQSLEGFFNEVVESCTIQNAEVHALKQNLLQSWAWYEEIKSRHVTSKDESMMFLIRAQPLDSASEKQLQDIRHANYYLESQIVQTHLALDEQWENFQDYCKKTHKIQIPTMEMIFQTMVKQNAILRKQNYILKDIASRIKKKKHSALGLSLLVVMDGTKDLPDEIKIMNPEDICQIQYEHVVNRMRNFTTKKTDNLRTFLKKREYPHVCAVKPQLYTSIIQTSSTKLSQLSLCTSTRVCKEHLLNNLEFVQSTPKPLVIKPDSNTPEINASTGLQELQNFARKFENFPEKTFAPLNKNVIAGSPNSAFVSTFGNNSLTSSATPLSFKSTLLTVTSTVTDPTIHQRYITTAREPIVSISTNNVSKPFTFANSSGTPVPIQGIGNAAKSGVGVKMLANFTKPASFNLQTIPSTTPAFATIDVKNAITCKSATSVDMGSNKFPSPIFSFNQTTPSETPIAVASSASLTNISSKIPATSVLTFGVVTTSTASSTTQFSLSINTGSSNLFGITNQKSTEPSVAAATSKPFVFSSKTTSTTMQNRLLTSPNVVNTISSLQTAVSFTPPVTASFDSAKFTSNSQPVIFAAPSSTTITPKITTQVMPTTVLASSIFTSTQTAATSSLLGIFAVTNTPQNSIFSSSVATSSVSSPVFSMGGIKSSVFAPTSQIVSSPTVTTTIPVVTSSSTVISTTSLPATTTSVSISPLVAVSSIESTTSRQSIFGSASGTNVPPSSTLSSSTGIIFGGSSSSKPLIFGDSDVDYSKLSMNIQSITSTAANFETLVTSITQSSIFGSTPSPTSAATGFAAVPISTATGFAVPSTSVAVTGFSVAPTPAATGFAVASTTSGVTGFAVSATTSATTGFTSTNASTTQLIFGGSSSGDQKPVFGISVMSVPAKSSIFDNGSGSTTSQTEVFGVFGGAPQKSSIFGNNVTTNSTQSSTFGNSQSTLFGNTTTTTTSTFGQRQSAFDSFKSTSSVFGQTTPFGSSGNSFGNTNVFGGTITSFGQSSTSIFGNTNTPITTSASIFGGTPTTSSTFGSGATVFGAPISSTSPPIFGSDSVFSSTTAQPSSFVANTSTGSFGFGSLNVGPTPSTSNSGFGTTATSNPFGGDKNIFGGSATPGSNSLSASNSGSLFGNGTQNFSGNFGSQSPFGQQSNFGQSSFGNSYFAQQSAGPFSDGSSGGVGQTGFGASSSFQKPGFGGSPVFGSSPSFGNAQSFGGAPAFGSPSVFGNTSKIFGSGTAAFGASSSPQNTAFSNIANQPTVGFGNLAQQATNAPSSNAPFSGSSSFSSWR